MQRLVLAGVVAVVAVTGCGETNVDGGATTATGGASSSGGTNSAIGGASGATAGAGRSLAGSAGFMTEEQWDALSGPQPGDHAVLTKDCERETIAQEYRVLPTVECAVVPDYDYETNRVRACDIRPYCTRHADCLDRPFGACRGILDAYCEYAGVRDEQCATDADCTTVPNGHCYDSDFEEVLCFPTGECVSPQPTCYYPNVGCADDSNCDDLPGGRCVKVVRYTACVYDECRADADCGAARRCACSGSDTTHNVCVPADCDADADCDDGQQCRLEYGCYQSAAGYHCSTTADACGQDVDCGLLSCRFQDEHWQCVDPECPLID